MSNPKPGRGRPKGSGLNDSAQLRAIATLIAADPSLKPTTAIKHLGVTDPSVIRRLRDKYKVFQDTGAAPRTTPIVYTVTVPQAQAPVRAGNIVPITAARDQKRAAAMPAATAERPQSPAGPAAVVTQIVAAPVVRIEAEPQAPVLIGSGRATGAPRPDFSDGLSSVLGAQISAFVLSFEAQFTAIAYAFQWPPLAAVLSSQAAFTHAALSMTLPPGTAGES